MRQALCLASSQYSQERFQRDIQYIHDFFSKSAVTSEHGHLTASRVSDYFGPGRRWDAVHLGLSTLPAAIGTALLDPASGVLVLAVIPWLALRTATAVRAAVPDETAMTVLFGEGAAVSALLALMPWSVLPALAGAPFALCVAARRDRELKR